VKHRLTASMLALFLVLVAAGCGSDHNDRKGAKSTTTSGATTTAPNTGSSTAANPNTISIFASTEVSQALEQLTSTYKTAHPEVTFQVTTGNTDQLADQVSKGARPNLYIDEEKALGRLSKSVIKGALAVFGTDVPVVVVKKGNPKRIQGLQAFAAQPATTSGLCTPDVPCGVSGRYLLAALRVPAVPDVTEANQSTLVDDVAVGGVDVAIVMRSASRNRFFKLQGLPLWFGPRISVNYKIATISDSSQAQDFLTYVTTYDAARKILVARGFRSLFELKPAASTATTTAAAGATTTTKKP
jgi:molybdate transport system substrate-binding protein